MKGVIRDTGLDHLIRVLFKQEPPLPTRDSSGRPSSDSGTSSHNATKRATVSPISPQNGPVAEKILVPQLSEDTFEGLERGVAENVVGWCGPDDPEVHLKLGRGYDPADQSCRIQSTSHPG